MSCHTWCARKVDRSIEEAREKYIKQQIESIRSAIKMLNDPTDECRVAYEWSEEYIQNSLHVMWRQLRMVENGFCNVAVMNKQPETSYYIPGKGFFINCDEHGNQFRIGGYPEDQIFSKEECLKFIEDNKDKIKFFDKTYEWLDEFWDKYPDGFMHFG
jgi:hypothetical protein